MKEGLIISNGVSVVKISCWMGDWLIGSVMVSGFNLHGFFVCEGWGGVWI